MSKNAVSFFLREVIHSAGASRPEVGSVRAHEIRSASTSVAFHRNWSVSSVLESTTWSSSSVFSSFIYVTFSTNTVAFCRWVRSWLWVRGLSSPHLFLTCSGGGGGAVWSLFPLLRVSCTFSCDWMCGLPILLRNGCWGAPFLYFIAFLILHILFILFICFMHVPALKLSRGVMLFGHKT